MTICDNNIKKEIAEKKSLHKDSPEKFFQLILTSQTLRLQCKKKTKRRWQGQSCQGAAGAFASESATLCVANYLLQTLETHG